MELFKNLLILMLFVVSICHSQEKRASIIYISPEQIKSIGEDVTMNCTVDNVGELPVFWNKKHRGVTTDQTVVSVNRNKLVNDARFDLVFENQTKSMTFSLKIKDIQIHDSGIYECQIVIDFVNKVTEMVELQVRSPPQIIDQHSTLEVTAAAGESVVLKCFAEGYPRPTITWTRENGAILPSGGQSVDGQELKITNVKKEDRGTYYCTANNGVGDAVQRSINFEVEFAPVISVYRPKIAQAHGYSIDLECNVMAYPPPQIEWTKKGVTLHNDDHYKISHLGTVNDLTMSKVTINSVEKHHYGDYECEAINKMGISQAKLHLYKAAIPAVYSGNNPQAFPNINYSGLVWVEKPNYSKGNNLHHSKLMFALIPIINLLILITIH